MIINSTDIEAIEKKQRVQLATSLPGVKPISLIGTRSFNGITNLAPFSSITHLGSHPMLIAMVTRPDTVGRHTLRNILETDSWTINHVHAEILDKAHQCSARYPEEISEFTAVGLTEQFHQNITAPFVKESRLKYALDLEDVVDIKANNTKLIIGKVSLIELPENAIDEDGCINLEKLGSLASTALDTYFSVSKLTQLKYPKP